MNNKIQNVHLNRNYNYLDRQLNDFFEKIAISEKNIYDEITVDEILNTTKSFVCIMIDEELPSSVLEKIKAMFQQNVRVYILTKNFYESYNLSIAGYSHIRICEDISGTMIISDPKKTKASIYIAKNKGVLIKYPNNIIDESFQFFCYNFWHNSTHELIDSKMIQKASREPIDIFPLLAPKHFFYSNSRIKNDKDKIFNLMESAKTDIEIVSDYYGYSTELFDELIQKSNNNVNIILYFKNDTKNKELLEYFKNTNINLVAIEDCKVQYINVDKKHLYFLMTNMESALKSNANQCSCGVYTENFQVEINNYIDFLWRFNDFSTLGDLESDVIMMQLAGNSNKEIKIIDNTVCSEEVELENLEDLKDQAFDENYIKLKGYSNPEISKNISFNIILKPKQREESAREDILYSQWGAVKEKLSRNIDSLNKKLEESKQKRDSNEANIVNMFKSIFTGKSISYGKMSKDLKNAKLSLESPNLNINKTEELIKILNNIYNNIKNDMLDIDKTLKQNQQYKEWEKQKNFREQDLENYHKKYIENEKKYNESEIHQELEVAKKSISQLETKISEERKKIESKSDYKKTLGKYESILSNINNYIKKERNNKKHKDLENGTKEISRSLVELSENKNKVEEDLANLQPVEGSIFKSYYNYFFNNFLDCVNNNEICEILNVLYLIKVDNEKLQEKMLDFSQKEKQFFDLKTIFMNSESKYKKEKLDFDNKFSEFIFKENDYKVDTSFEEVASKKKKKQKENKTKENLIEITKFEEVPQEDIPLVGKLYTQKNSRYLAIEYWEQLEQARIEAKRLNAKIVCERG